MAIALAISAICGVVGAIVFTGLTRFWSQPMLATWCANHSVGLLLALVTIYGQYPAASYGLVLWNFLFAAGALSAWVAEINRQNLPIPQIEHQRGES